VVRPNFDSLYAMTWLDLSDGPVIVSVPDTDGRYYVLPMYDMWTDAIAAPGWRTSGTRGAAWGFVPPGWTRNAPAGVSTIHAPTSTIWIIGRTQTNGPADYEAVNKLQHGFALTPLTRSGEPAPPATARIDPTIDMETEPLRQVNALSAVDYFQRRSDIDGTGSDFRGGVGQGDRSLLAARIQMAWNRPGFESKLTPASPPTPPR